MFIKNREVPTWLSHQRSGQSQQPAKLSMTQKHRTENSSSSTLQRPLQLHLFITRQNILSLLHQIFSNSHPKIMPSPPLSLQLSLEFHPLRQTFLLSTNFCCAFLLYLRPLAQPLFSIRFVLFLPPFPALASSTSLPRSTSFRHHILLHNSSMQCRSTPSIPPSSSC